MVAGQPELGPGRAAGHYSWQHRLPAASAGYLRWAGFAGLFFAGLLLGIMAVLLGALFQGQDLSLLPDEMLQPQLLRLVGGAVIQASLSAVLSIIVGAGCALCVFRRGMFFGRSALLTLSFLAMIMPTTVAAVSLLSLWGRQGVVRQSVNSLFGTDLLFAPYGLFMVILAHMFFNAPLVMRVCLSVLQAIPESQMKLAAQLRFGAGSYLRFIEWPAVKQALPSLFGLIFLLCFSSFSLVLMLGGGPAVSTLEVAIYTALRFEFNLPRAGALALLQLLISSVVILSLSRLELQSWTSRLDAMKTVPRSDRDRISVKSLDIFVVALFCLIVVGPVLSLILGIDIGGGAGLFHRPVFWSALFSSCLLGLTAAAASTAAALLLAAGRCHLQYFDHPLIRERGAEIIALSVSVYLVLPAIVLGTASFLLLRGIADLFASAFWLVLFSNTLMSLPFAARILMARYSAVVSRSHRLALSLNLRGYSYFSRIILPAMRHEIGLSLGLCCALSLGDFGVIALFGSDRFQTLPWLLYQYASRYGGPEAEVLSLLLLLLAVALYWLLYKSVGLWAERGLRPC